MKISDFLTKVKNGFLDIVYPVKCYCCGVITEQGDELCPDCRKNLEYINLDKRCKYCGKEKDSCDCSVFVHRYKELLAVFRYEGTAKRIMLRYKMYSKRQYSDFFVKEMTLAIMQEYKDYPINAVAFVPISFNSFRKRGYNQSKILAKKIAKMLNIKLYTSLKVDKIRRPQHKSKSRTERLYNAKYKYVCKDDMTGKTVLLIDDIATTGSTLDDCTRALLFAGADEVYGAVAMVTSVKNKK